MTERRRLPARPQARISLRQCLDDPNLLGSVLDGDLMVRMARAAVCKSR
jgi:hypothetical protein